MKDMVLKSAVVFAAFVLVGASIGFALYTYTQYTSLLETRRTLPPRTLTFTVLISSFNAEQSMLYAEVLGGIVPRGVRIAVSLRPSTFIETRRPELEDGTIIKLSPALPSTVADLLPGEVAHLTVELASDNTFIANSILIGDVFAINGTSAIPQ